MSENNNVDRDKIIRQVLKLRERAELQETGVAGMSEGEAQAFAAQMQRMMLQHKIREDELKVAGEKRAVEPVVEKWWQGKVVNDPSRPEGSLHANRIEWVEELARTVAQAHYCRIMIRTGSKYWLDQAERPGSEEKREKYLAWGSAGVAFVGRTSDATAALTTFEVMLESMAKLGSRAYFEAYGRHLRGEASWQRGFYRSWMLGFAARLGERYEEELGAVDVELRQLEAPDRRLLGGDSPAEPAAQCQALVRIAKDALDAVDEYFDLKRGKGELTSARRVGQGVSNGGAYAKGRAAADRIKLKADERIEGGAKGLLS